MDEAIRLAIASERIPETLVESFIEAMTGADGDLQHESERRQVQPTS